MSGWGSAADRSGGRWSTLRDRLAGQLWVWPTVFVVVAMVLAWVLPLMDERLEGWWLTDFPGGPQSARSLLSSIAGAMITFTGLVFSITVLVLQLASQQFSPRVLSAFLRDQVSQLALAMFTATFTYALIVLRRIEAEDVPAVSVTFAVVLVFGSVAMFVAYISHMANSIRVTSIMARVAAEARDLIDRTFPEGEGEPDADAAESKRWFEAEADVQVAASSPGVLQAVDIRSAVQAARGLDATIVVRPKVGDFVPEGGVVLAVHGAAPPEDGPDLGELFTISGERSPRQDPAFAFRQLADIAERALSPSTNDVTTAVQAIDRMHDLLRRIAVRSFPSPVHRDGDGVVRLVVRPVSWDGLVTLAVAEVRSYGATAIQVHRRLRSMLHDLLDVAPPARRPILRVELAALDEALGRLHLERDRELARERDAQGLGD